MSAPIAWAPAQYLRFEDERTRPARDLLAQVRHAAPALVVDVGCGPGNSTELLAARWPEADVLGIDTSGTMLSEARKRLPRARFETADASTWLPDPGTGVVFANAVYQWIADHVAVLPRVLERLAPGAVLAVQMPDNLMQPMHVLMRQVAAGGPFATKLDGVARARLPAVDAYYDALSPHARRVDIWHTVYNHVMPNAAAIVEWVKGTGANPFLQRLEPAGQQQFLATYLTAIEQAYPPVKDGKVLMSFSRLFIIAER